MRLFRCQSFQTEVIDDQQAWGNQLEQFPVQGVIGAGGIENLEHFGRLDDYDILVTAAGCMGHGVGEEGVANANRTGKNDVFFAVHPVKTNESFKPVTVKS